VSSGDDFTNSRNHMKNFPAVSISEVKEVLPPPLKSRPSEAHAR